MIAFLVAVLTCTPIATDGDSIRCGDERIRLLAIDAPEMGPCQPKGRVCVPGDPIRSRDSLAKAISFGTVEIERVGKDRYGRTLAIVTSVVGNLSCHQVATGNAIYVRKWDKSDAIRTACYIAPQGEKCGVRGEVG
ncbi:MULTISPECIES: thermonuclease family protein [Asticcacaulis]|uniref:thermonuclease family protein n=1 Tax=Asticcacaulis TaxID=76890 RepID=UPI0028553551|nr:thermonuclease family protein [Asticcacaulis sp. BE141]MBP2159583.1 endonuclease YncB(thermonuclease family) [Asticcacaulis solisilvae]MDR6800590.1 endonuclease YncB(thermonuclease family) [Asticcacaulis sp. BE141]